MTQYTNAARKRQLSTSSETAEHVTVGTVEHAAPGRAVLRAALSRPSKRRLMSFTPILADYIYIGGGAIAAIILIVVVIWLLRRA